MSRFANQQRNLKKMLKPFLYSKVQGRFFFRYHGNVLHFTAVFLLLIFIISSCDRSRIFEENITVERGIWSANNSIDFPVNIQDTSGFYNIYLNIRNEGNYPYRNLYLFVQVTSPQGNKLTDTLDIELADASGLWHGSGIGDLFFLQIPFRQMVRFPVPGIYRFSVLQGMRDKELKGIRNVGLRIEKAKETERGAEK